MPNLEKSNLMHLAVTLRVKGALGTREVDPMRVQGLQGPDGFKVTAGYAGLTEVPRPRRVSMVHYQGAPPIHLTGQIVLDTWTWWPEATVDGDVHMLEVMAGLDPRHVKPYVLNIVGNGIPHTQFDWFIWDLTWGDMIRNTEGQLKQQWVDIELVEAVGPGYDRPVEDIDNIEQPSSGHGRFYPTPKNKKFAGTWLVKKGDTLQFIAKQVYHDVSRWKLIARANNITNPKRLQPGQKLKCPRLPKSKGNPYGVGETASQRSG
jgi:hypothetical protein